MSMTKRQFRELLRGSIKTRKSFERQAIAENLKEEGYEPLDEDDFTDAETADEDAMGGETVFQPTTLPEGNGWDDYAPDDDSGARHQQDNYTIGPYGDQVASRKPKLFQRKSTVPIHMDVVKGGREDALAGLPMNTRYKLQPKYIAAYEKALAAKDEPMSRKSLEEGCGEMPMTEPEMEDEEFSFTGDIGELSGDEAFAVGWAAALEQARTTIEGLLNNSGAEEPLPGDEDDAFAETLDEDGYDDEVRRYRSRQDDIRGRKPVRYEPEPGDDMSYDRKAGHFTKKGYKKRRGSMEE